MMNKTELPISDRLAFDRTHLANERTLLAYVRTFIGMVSAGIAILKVFDFSWARPIAWVFLAAALPMLAVGIYRYLKTARGLKQYRSGNVNRTKGKPGNA